MTYLDFSHMLSEMSSCTLTCRRGNPLHLCHERYQKLQKLWMSHGIAEEIVHLLESNTNLMSFDWQNM